MTTNAGGTTRLNGDVTTSETGQIYNDDVTVVSNISLTANGLDCGGTVSGMGNRKGDCWRVLRTRGKNFPNALVHNWLRIAIVLFEKSPVLIYLNLLNVKVLTQSVEFFLSIRSFIK